MTREEEAMLIHVQAHTDMDSDLAMAFDRAVCAAAHLKQMLGTFDWSFESAFSLEMAASNYKIARSNAETMLGLALAKRPNA